MYEFTRFIAKKLKRPFFGVEQYPHLHMNMSTGILCFLAAVDGLCASGGTG